MCHIRIGSLDHKEVTADAEWGCEVLHRACSLPQRRLAAVVVVAAIGCGRRRSGAVVAAVIVAERAVGDRVKEPADNHSRERARREQRGE